MPTHGADSTAADSLRPAGEACERFAAGLEALWPEGARDAGARLAIAVSGGPDSMALLLLAAASLPGRIVAATVDHGLRSESKAEAEMVARLCDRLDVAHSTMKVEVAPGNLQSQARHARYAALADWMSGAGAAALATAHHADDQAETLMLRLNRGSGVAGLAGVRARGAVPGTRLPLLRPVLDWRREDLQNVVATAGVACADDPSNRDERFDRARIRKHLTGADWLDARAIAASASHLAEADEALDWAAAREWAEAVREVPGGLSYRPLAPRAVRLRVLAAMIEQVGGEIARGGQIAALHDALEGGSPASLGECVGRPQAGVWSIARAPRRSTRTKP